MKKKFISVLVSTVLLFIATAVSTYVASGAGNTPTLIYSCLDFEDQAAGDKPYGLHWNWGGDSISVEKSAVSGNQNNKAMRLTYSGTGDVPRAMVPLHYAPIKDNFVLGFKFKCDNVNAFQRLMVSADATEPDNSLYLTTTGTAFNLMMVKGGKLYSGAYPSARSVSSNTWYSVEYEVNMSTKKMNVYLNNTKILTNVSISSSPVTNIAGLTFLAPDAAAGWYIDDIKLYLGSRLSSADFAAQQNLYENSEIIPEHKYELGRLYQYDKFVFATLYNKFVARVDGIKYYKNNAYRSLSAPVTDDDDGVISVPAKDFAEALGGTCSISGNTVTVSGGGKTTRLTVGTDAFSQNGVIYTELDKLTSFFEISYFRNGDLLSFGEELTCPYDLGVMVKNQRGYTMEEEVFERIANSLMYDRPSKEQIIDAFETNNPQHAHPSLLITDFSEIINNRSRDASYSGTVAALITRADNYVNQAPVEYTKGDGTRGDFAQPLADRGTYLSFAYKITGDVKYKNALWNNLVAAAGFPDFNPGHFLDLGICANGIKFAYDWLYDDWTPAQRQTIESIIINKILTPAMTAYRSPLGSNETGFAYSTGNQPVIINCGIAGCALALLGNENYSDIGAEAVACSLRSVETCFNEFAPDGAWTEGVAYWRDTMGSLPTLIDDYKTALGSDYGLLRTPALDKTPYFPIAAYGAKATFPMGDDTEVDASHPSFMWFAKNFNDMTLAAMRKNTPNGPSITDVVNWVFDSPAVNPTISNDKYFRKMETVSMRTGWSTEDTVAILHGGQNNTNHGHLDNGTFQIDMLGERWACEVPKEDYTKLYTGSSNSTTYETGDYYRFKAEGHNTVIANLAASRDNHYDQVPEAFAKIVKYSSTDAGSFAILDMTETNSLYQNAKRGLLLDKAKHTVIVQDDFRASQETEFWWFMHTKVNSITLSQDGKGALLYKIGGKRVWVCIISDGDETFQVMDAKPMEGYYNIPTNQSANTGYKKLAVKKNTDNFKLAVAFIPLTNGATEPDEIPEYKPMELWNFGDETIIEEDRYDVKGIADGDRFAVPAAGETKQKVYVVDKDAAAGLTPASATKLASADFYVDDVLVGSASSAPYCCDIPLTPGDHTLKVMANTTGLNTYEIGTYNYSAEVLADTADSVKEDFESGNIGDDVNFGSKSIASTESCKYKLAPVTGSKAMTFTYDGNNESGTSYISTSKIAIPESKLLTLDYDFYSENSSGNKISHHLRDEQGSAVVPGYNFGELGSGKYAKDTWHHVSYIFDFERGEFRGYLDGYEIERGAVAATSKNNAYTRFYLYRYSVGTVYIDNFKFCGKGANINITPYAVKGIVEGERIPACANSSNLSRTISVVDADADSKTITPATSFAKAEFYIDGEKAATVTSNPCKWNMPITDLKPHKLTVVVTDTAGGVQSFGPYNYTVCNMEAGSTSFKEYFEGTEGGSVTKDNLSAGSRIGAFTSTENPVYAKASGGDGTAMKLTMSSGKSTSFKTKEDISVAESGITTYDFDFYSTSGSEYYKIYIYTRNSSGFNMKNGSMTILDNLTMKEVEKNKWHHVSFVFDAQRLEYCAFLDGYEFERGQMDSRTPGRNVYFQLQTQSYTSGEFYFDNLEIMSETETDNDTAGVVYKGDKANAVVINGGVEKKKFTVFSAVYGTNKLADISAETVELAGREIWQSTKSTASSAGNKTVIYIWDTGMKPLAKSIVR